MDKCKYYKIKYKVEKSKAIPQDRIGIKPQVFEIPICNHPDYPYKEHEKGRVMMGYELKCDGNTDKCVI